VQKILHPEDSYFSIWTASALIVGIIAKLFLTWWKNSCPQDEEFSALILPKV